MMLSTIDTEERIEAFRPVLDEMMREGLVVLSDVDIVTYRYSNSVQSDAEVSRGEGIVYWKARSHLLQRDGNKWQDQPLYEAIIERCGQIGVAGATVYRGLEGFDMSAEVHKLRIWPFSNKDAPVMLSIIDRDEAVARLLPVLNEMMSEGLVATSNVEIVRYSTD